MESLENKLLELIAMRDWKKIIQLNGCYSLNEKSRFLWAWPSEKCLQKLKSVLTENHVQCILSIGCGSGLLEWILEESTGLSVTGVELINSLWASNYSPSKFIKLNFIEGDPSTECLQACVSPSNIDNFALLFCYFNNKLAFDKYVEAYRGSVVIIIGPRNDCDIVTDPMPLNPQFCKSDWMLESIIDIDVDCNVAALYRRELPATNQ